MTDKSKTITDVLRVAQEITGWSEEECRNFLSSIRAKSPEQLLVDCDAALDIAKKAETIVAAVDIMKMAGRVMEVMIEDGEFSMRLNPDVEVEFRDEDGAVSLALDKP